MLRVKVAVVYVILTAILVGAALGLVHYRVTELALAQTRATLVQASAGAQRSSQLDEASLIARALFVASGDRLYRSLQGEFVQDKFPEDGEAPADFDFEGERHIDADEKLKARKFHFDDFEKADADVPEELRSLLTRQPRELEIFMVLDAQGKGVAALGKDLYSWFGDDVGKSHPIVMQVAKGGLPVRAYWRWAFKANTEPHLYRVAIAPVRRTHEETPSGVVVLGSMVNDGLAAQKKAAFAGSDETPVEIAYYAGTDVVGSTLDPTRQQAFAKALAEGALADVALGEPTTVTVAGEPWLAVVSILQGGDAPVYVVAMSEVAAATSAVAMIRSDVLLIGGVMLLLGVLLLVLLVHRFIGPIEALEDGVQEVIAGRKDFVWQPQSGHDVQSSLAQQLNMLSAFLQGKPMPDDEQSPSGWGDLIPGASGEQKQEGPSKVQGVDLAGLMGASPKTKSDAPNDEGDS